MSLGIADYTEDVVRPINRPRVGTIALAVGVLALAVTGGFLADNLMAQRKAAGLAWSGGLPSTVAPTEPVSALVTPLAGEATPAKPRFNAASYDLLFGPSVQATTFLRPAAPVVAEAEVPQDVPPAVALAAPRLLDSTAIPVPEARPDDMADASDAVIPLPPPNPFRPRALVRTDQPPRDTTARRVVASVAPQQQQQQDGGFFQRLFGGMGQSNGQGGSGQALAYARTEEPAPALNPIVPRLPQADASRTAVYDIQAGMVYMPNGERLEAHSGLGPLFDDPRAITVKNRGPTPPNVYDLTMREALFHGVRALRMTPAEGSRMYGRDGILAHSYMLGPRGDSNGCVSFRNYDQFLQAFMRGEVRRLVVVTSSGQSVAQRIAQSRT